jgi:HrpA-like RNA helicase
MTYILFVSSTGIESKRQSNQDPSWTSQNYLSMRALKHAHSVRAQLCALLQKPEINIDTALSCKPEKEPFLRCLTHGLFQNVAKRVATRDVIGGTGLRGRNSAQVQKAIIDATEAPYRTVRGGQPVHIHPSSVLFSAPSGTSLSSLSVLSVPSAVAISRLFGIMIIDNYSDFCITAAAYVTFVL